ALDRNALNTAEQFIAGAQQLVSDHPEAAKLRSELEARRSVPDGFVYLPGGRYALGRADEPHNNPRVVILDPVYIAVHEVTNAEYAEFTAAGGYGEGAWWPQGTTPEWIATLKDASGQPGPATWTGGTYPAGQERHPVTGISWTEAAAYARWRGARLPTEWEWEAAASAGGAGSTRYPWGESWDPARVGLGPGRDPAIGPVGSNPGDRSPLGCLDMAGSAKEWTGSNWAEGDDNRVLRGGCSHPVAVSLAEPSRSCSAAHRLARANGRTVRIPGVGFRLAKEVRP
ncbi:MAG: formylglycine-generating enzyme family protein, partial [Planctomycetota bacterium]